MSFQLFSNYKPSRNESFQIRDSVILRNVYTSERTKRERKTGSENPHIAAKIPSLSANIFRIQLPAQRQAKCLASTRGKILP